MQPTANNQQTPYRALWRLLTLVIGVIGFIGLAAGTASAFTATTAHSSSGHSAVVGPETRVGVTTHFSGGSSARISTVSPACVGENLPVYGGFVLVSCVATKPGAPSGGWDLPAGGGGKTIGGRWYTEHALERIAPNTPEVMSTLSQRALARAEAAGLKPGTPEFGQWWAKNGPAPRNVPPMVVEAEILSPGSTSVRVITNSNGDVVTVIPR